MPNALVFVDTNILVYAHDRHAGEKHRIAKEKVLALWNRSIPPAISVQVLQELYVNLLRKNLSVRDAKDFINDYLRWTVIPNDASLLVDAIAHSERWKISLWDSLIVAASARAGAVELWSEDLNEGQDYGGVRVVNPLR